MNKRVLALKFAAGFSALALLGAGCTKAPEPVVVAPAPAASASVIQFSPTVSAPIPAGWTIKTNTSDPQYTYYDVAFPTAKTFGLQSINVKAWLAGPNPDEGYVISHDQRPAALAVLQGVYDHKAVTADDQKKFEANAGEFLGYSQQYRAALKYFASDDDSFRGISFYNLQGQDVLTEPAYYVTVYDPARDMILAGSWQAAGTEFDKANAWTANLGKMSGAEATKNDRTAKLEVQKILEQTPSANLSFGDSLKRIDAFFHSVSGK